ncbi:MULTISPECIES: MarC family NAAT transporter [Salegentibacter]|uniref:MarC family NAAT transporter n=1 Tax=Salegentibacter TaxID=143222 RepID=UPI00187B39B2|nr:MULTISPECIES: MarC family NAAT transporter [Salegentibacter]MBE7639687.1 MarC family NAAT transporter [Salegentibacter sp. BLCTC]MBI6115628.1 MarC family NAAT transporter [Salegentibacter maritimus]
MELFIYAFAALFSVMNPLGTVPIFVGLTREYSAKEQSKTSLLTAINVFVILLISFFIGRYILHFFGISIESLRIAGGLIIVTSGFALLTGSFSKHKGMEKERVKNDAFQRNNVSLTPLAIPMLAGPGSISLLIGMYEDYTVISQKLIAVLAILGVCLATFLVLRSSHYIVKMLGASGINAISRIIGFIVIAIGIEYISSSVILVLSDAFK